MMSPNSPTTVRGKRTCLYGRIQGNEYLPLELVNRLSTPKPCSCRHVGMSRSPLHWPWHARTFMMVKARQQGRPEENEQDCDCPLPRPRAGAVPGPELPLPVAGRPAGLLGLRDGRRDPELVRAGLDRFSPGAGDFRLAAVPRHPDLSVL